MCSAFFFVSVQIAERVQATSPANVARCFLLVQREIRILEKKKVSARFLDISNSNRLRRVSHANRTSINTQDSPIITLNSSQLLVLRDHSVWLSDTL